MTWTAPLTATTNATFTAAQFNACVRDNLLETEAALATSAGGLFISQGANSIAQRAVNSGAYSPYESTASTAYVDLPHPVAVGANTGTQALVFWTCGEYNSSANATSLCSVAVSGISTAMAASDDRAMSIGGLTAANVSVKRGMFNLFAGLTAGYNVFTLKYRVSAGTGFFGNRTLTVFPL